MNPRIILTAAVAGLFCAQALVAQPAKPPTKPATAAPAGAWAKVPPLSTLCYGFAGEEWEPFIGRLEAAKAAIQADRDKQDAINAKIEEDFRSIDPMEMASRMQQWMMSNPEEAMKFMQGQQAMAEQVTADVNALQEREQARDAEWKALVKRYEDALIQAYGPVQARLDAMRGSKTTDRKDLLYPSFFGDPSMSDAEWAAGEAANAAADNAYQALCPQWWGANGQFHAYLKKQKAWFIQQRIPELERNDAPRLQQYAIMNTPAASYRSTAPLKGVTEYLDLVWKVYRVRDSKPRCTATHTCGGAHP
jgi:predicted secreted protein